MTKREQLKQLSRKANYRLRKIEKSREETTSKYKRYYDEKYAKAYSYLNDRKRFSAGRKNQTQAEINAELRAVKEFLKRYDTVTKQEEKQLYKAKKELAEIRNKYNKLFKSPNIPLTYKIEDLKKKDLKTFNPHNIAAVDEVKKRVDKKIKHYEKSRKTLMAKNERLNKKAAVTYTNIMDKFGTLLASLQYASEQTMDTVISKVEDGDGYDEIAKHLLIMVHRKEPTKDTRLLLEELGVDVDALNEQMIRRGRNRLYKQRGK